MLGTALPVTVAAEEQAIIVTSTTDSGPGTFREALLQATTGATITFDPSVFPPDNPTTISVLAPLPELTQGQVTVDASDSGVILDGSQIPRGDATDGLIVASHGNVIRGLQILRFSASGVVIMRGSQGNTIGGDRTIGMGPTGQGNVISENAQQGITIRDSETGHNVVTGNYIGTDPAGSLAWGNGNHGIMIQRSANNIVGGTVPGERNVISGNRGAGVRIEYPESMDNVVIGNHIGTDTSGTIALGADSDGGAHIAWGASQNRVGGVAEGEGNLISGNDGVAGGVAIEGLGTDHNLVLGNLIGTDASGTASMGNAFHGVTIGGGAQQNLIGGATAAERNIISGSAWDGVLIHDSDTMYNIVSGNYIGTDVSGTAPIPNGSFGVNLETAAQHNIIGGDGAGEGNVISGNLSGGVNVSGSEVGANVISGNYIGTDANGTASLGNVGPGITISSNARNNVVGGTTQEEGNLISGNVGDGVIIASTGTISNYVLGNRVGTNAAGSAALGNTVDGIWIGDDAQHNVIGGSKPGEGNLISGNGNNGVVIDGSGTRYNTVSGNFIGTDVTGNKAVGNENHGVVLAWGAHNNLVGGATPGERNVISGNYRVGVNLANPGTVSNTIAGNYIGTDLTGTRAIGNRESGVYLGEGAQHNLIGGESLPEGNIISGNLDSGVRLADSDTMRNVITGNHIGTDLSGQVALGNEGHGVAVHDGAGPNTIGPRNTIAYNGANGVEVQGSDAVGNSITANSIHNNDGVGIRNWEGGNLELPPPTITRAGTRVIRGTAPPSSEVEIFFFDEESIQTYEGNTAADASGDFVFTIPAGRSIGPNVTATTIDREGNTSQFSSPRSPQSPVVTRELPGIVGPAQVSTEPSVVGTNLGLALFCVLFFGVTSTVFNSILKDYRDELFGAFAKSIPRSITDILSRTVPSMPRMADKGTGWFLITWLILLCVTSFIVSFLDPQLEVFSPDRLGLLITLFVSAMVVSGLEMDSDVYAHRRWAPTSRPETGVQWIGLAIAVGCVLLSRALDFRPGYLYGIVGAMYLLPKPTGIVNSGKRAIFVLLMLFLGGLVFWLASAFLPPSFAELEPLLLTAFLMCLQGVFFALIPMDITDGGDIWSWKRTMWFALFSIVFFCFYHFLLNPNASDVQALRQNGVQTLLILIAVFGLATLSLWVLLPFRLGRRSTNAQ